MSRVLLAVGLGPGAKKGAKMQNGEIPQALARGAFRGRLQGAGVRPSGPQRALSSPGLGYGPIRRPLEGLKRNPAAAILVIAYLFGVGGVRAAYLVAARTVDTDYILLFWTGFLAVLVATVAVGAGIHTRERTRWVLAVAYGLFTFLPKFLMSVSGPDFFDEFGHYRHAKDILAHHSAAITDNYLPITKYYPGIEVLTSAVHLVTRLSVWHSGQLVVAAAHVLSIIVVWRLAVALSVPAHMAFIAGIVFSLNPSFVYFDSEYAYESLGFPLAMAAILFAVRARRSPNERSALLWSLAAAVAAGAVVFTHHISAAFVVLGVLGVALLVPTEWSRRTNRVAFTGPWLAGLGAAALLAVWVATVARPTIGYLEPHVKQTLSQLEDLILRRKPHPSASPGGPTGRGPVGTGPYSAAPLGGRPAPGTTSGKGHLFGGSGLPTYEVVLGLASPVVTAIVVAGALLQAWRLRVARSAILRRAPFLILGVAYLLTLPIDLTSSGGETAHRLWAYAYFGVAICAVSGGHVWARLVERFRWSPNWVRAVAFAALIIVAVGNVASGEDIYYRFPGPYVFATDTRSRTPELFQLAQWCNTHVPSGTNVVTDRLTGEVIYAETALQVPAPSDSEVYKLFYEGNEATYGLRKYLRLHHFEYWILDLRIAYYSPVQKLFESYHGPRNVDGPLLLEAGGSRLLQVVYRSQNYEVLAINPFQ
jgi:hypothetical protein